MPTYPSFSRSFLFLSLLFFAHTGVSAQEVTLPATALEQMERYEVNKLQQADRSFDSKNFRQAEAAYDAFVLEFPESTVLAYAILRKGRSLHLDNKKFEAIKVYQDVIDFFPNEPLFAAAALYHIGEAHMGNGHPEPAVRAWTALAEDSGYVKQMIAARALQQLADYLVLNEEEEQAAKFYLQIITNFRKGNPQAANEAIRSLLDHAILRAPNEGLVRSAYKEAEGFEGNPKSIPEDFVNDPAYWQAVIGEIRRRGNFPADQEEEQKAFYRYWAEQLDARPADWDAVKLDRADFLLRADGDVAAWSKRVDALFAAQQNSSPERMLLWIRWMQEHPEKLEEYLAKLDPKALTPEQSYQLQETLAGSNASDAVVSRALQLSQAPSFTDAQLLRLIDLHSKKGLVRAMEYASSQMEDPERGQLEILRFYYHARQAEPGLALAEKLITSPKYADEAQFFKGLILEQTGRFEEAIAVFRQTRDPVQRYWRIAACFEAMKQPETAIKTLREAESVLEEQSPEAAWLIAQVYARTGQAVEAEKALRHLLDRYPASSRSRDAHLALESIGVTRTGGGVDAN